MITLKQILNQLLCDVTSDDPTREMSKTAEQLRKATHAALKEDQSTIGALRGPSCEEPDGVDEPISELDGEAPPVTLDTEQTNE